MFTTNFIKEIYEFELHSLSYRAETWKVTPLCKFHKLILHFSNANNYPILTPIDLNLSSMDYLLQNLQLPFRKFLHISCTSWAIESQTWPHRKIIPCPSALIYINCLTLQGFKIFFSAPNELIPFINASVLYQFSLIS